MTRQAPVMVDPRPRLEVDDRVNLADSKRAWTVRGVTRGGRFVILTQPFNLKRTVLYSVIDFDRGVRGKDNCYGLGYETDDQVADALHQFQHTENDDLPIGQHARPDCDDEWCAGSAEVSFRSGNHVRLDMTAINGQPCQWSGQPVELTGVTR